MQVSCSVQLAFCVCCSLAVQLECLVVQQLCSSMAGNALAGSARLQNKPSFTVGKRCFVLDTKKYCQHYCSITTVTLFSGVSQHSVCVTDPHNSTAVEALLTPQINGECSLAGVSASCCGVYIRSNCFWSGRGTVFSPVRIAALALSQIILIPSICSLSCSMKDSRKGSDLGNLTIFIRFLLLHSVCFGTEYLECNNPTDCMGELVWLSPYRSWLTTLEVVIRTHSVQWVNARTSKTQSLVLESSMFKIGYKNCSWI